MSFMHESDSISLSKRKVTKVVFLLPVWHIKILILLQNCYLSKSYLQTTSDHLFCQYVPVTGGGDLSGSYSLKITYFVCFSKERASK